MTTPTSPSTLANVVFPDQSLARDAGLIVASSLFIALMAQITIPLPYVPITGQTLAIFLVALALGSRLATLAVIAYILEAIAGLPVLAEFKSAWSAGASGIPAIVGPTAGFIFGFVPAAFVLGWLADRGWTRHILLVFAGMLIATVVLYAPGLVWLARFTGWDKVLEFGFYPFVAGDTAKAIIAALALPGAWKLVGKG